MFSLRTGNKPASLCARGVLVCVGLAVASAATWANGTHTGHQFAVTEGGAATVSIPIQVPRGIGGLEPQLSLNYSSSAGNAAHTGLPTNTGGGARQARTANPSASASTR